MRVAGLDGWKHRWAVVILEDGRFASARPVDDLAQFLDTHPDLAAVAIDIPIGLPEAGARQADMEARSFLGPRASTLFVTPPREVLAKDTYGAANQLSKDKHGRGISKQSYNLKPKIDEVGALDDTRLHEVHPEVTFRALAGEPIEPKKSWSGQQVRRRLLEDAGIEIPEDLGELNKAPPDDVLDAAAAAWTAHRIALGKAECLPARPKRGEPTIWY